MGDARFFLWAAANGHRLQALLWMLCSARID
jgi:hypothetical protein